MTTPLAMNDDLTAKARIRNAALALFAEHGEDGASMRAIAAEAGVTVGLLVHHYGTKDGLREAVEQLVIDHFVHALQQADAASSPTEMVAVRDAAVAAMLRDNPAIVNYTRRAVLDPDGRRGTLIERLTDLTSREVTKLREAGAASTDRAESSQIVDVMVRGIGGYLLQPMIDAIWQHLDAGPPSTRPHIWVTVRERQEPVAST